MRYWRIATRIVHDAKVAINLRVSILLHSLGDPSFVYVYLFCLQYPQRKKKSRVVKSGDRRLIISRISGN